ncbi:hypothetical protein WKW80_09035 [Variovorax humicola]|uniref:Transposase n=1 Tax=Variovorax humicola TaxID=1769758 RepID=A0ABU8VY83_9BURK
MAGVLAATVAVEDQPGLLVRMTLEPRHAQRIDHELGEQKLMQRHGIRARGKRRFNNRTRLHSTLAYVSPMQFEQNWFANQPRQANS